MAARSRSFLVWGAGGHGKVVGDLVLAAGHDIAGYIDGDPDKVGQAIDTIGAPICWQEDAFLAYLLQSGYPETVDACALGIGDNRLRQQRLAALEGLEVPPVIHPSASISPNASIGRGSVVFPNAVVNAGAWIDEAVIVNSGAIIEHDCRRRPRWYGIGA